MAKSTTTSTATGNGKNAKPAAKPAAIAAEKSAMKPAVGVEAKGQPATAVKLPAPVEMKAKPVKAVKETKAKGDAAAEKPKKPKLVRDSFTMPEQEYAALGEVKKACLKAGFEVKKSELLRIGVSLVRQLDTAKLKEILAGLPALKAGRPKKNK